MNSDESFDLPHACHEKDSITETDDESESDSRGTIVNRLLNLILKLEYIEEDEEEHNWYHFLELIKTKLTNKPEKIVLILKNWLHDNQRDGRRNEDNINDFLLEYYCACSRKKQRIH